MQHEIVERACNNPEQMRRIRILHLEDSRFDRARLRRICALLDLPVALDEAATLQEFADMVSDMQYDLFILDCRLPVGSGFAALELLRSGATGENNTIVMTSGVDVPEFALAAKLGGCDLFFDKADLNTATLRHALSQSASRPLCAEDQRLPPTLRNPVPRVTYTLPQGEAGAPKYVMDASGQVLRGADLYQSKTENSAQARVNLLQQLLDTDEFIFH